MVRFKCYFSSLITLKAVLVHVKQCDVSETYLWETDLNFLENCLKWCSIRRLGR